jgi:signal transduction histidine kinase
MKMLPLKLHRRIGLMIVGVVLVTTSIFAWVAIGLAHSVENQLFIRALEDEVGRQQQSWAASATLPPPKLPYISIYRGAEALPDDLRAGVKEEPGQTEFQGTSGRHYHLVRFRLASNDGAAPAYAVAEVGRYLIVRPNLDWIVRLLLILSALIAALMGFVGFLLAKQSLKPLGLLARDVTVAGNAVPTIVAADYPANEIGMLAARLSHAFDRIRQFVAREQAFTRDASHELRTPIAVIRGAAEVLGLQPDLSQASRDALQRIDASTMDMAEALDLLLALARERDVQEWEPTSLLPLVEKAVADTAARFPGHQLAIAIAIDADLEVLVRPRLLQIVLNNLIANCFQHSQGTQLTIRSEARALVIADNGKGLHASDDPFKPYAKDAGSGGSGLGLDIVRRLCAVDDIDLLHRHGATNLGAEFLLKFNREYLHLDMGNYIFKTA